LSGRECESFIGIGWSDLLRYRKDKQEEIIIVSFRK
jgi:hypothetical protein